MRRSARALAVLGPASLLAVSCLSGGSSSGGLPSAGDASAGTGPQVVFDVFAESVPDVPFPNDIATRVDFASPTGVRINASLLGPTRLERDVRRNFDQLDGWGTIGPITVQFTERVNLKNLRERHAGVDFSDDAVYLVNIDPKSPKFGEPVPLDLGNGNYPVGLQTSAKSQYFRLDPRAGTSNIVFDVVAEDRNGNGVLDPGEDTDFDGELDEPNILYDDDTGELCSAATEHAPACDPDRRLVDFYEFKTNTLIMRPVAPLEQESRYAVVLTKRLVGYDGEPVRSPFRTINHSRQTEPLSVLPRVLAGLGVGMDEAAFAWSFTTQSVTRDLEAIAAGIRGSGPFAWLNEEYPPAFSSLVNFGNPDVLGGPFGSPYVLTRDQLAGILLLFSFIQFNGFGIFEGDELLEAVLAINRSYESVAYIVSGSFTTPNFVGTDEEIFRVDRRTGAAEVHPDEATFFITIPVETEICHPPFRTMFYGHGYSVSKLEALGFAGDYAKHCLATIGLDAPGHGPEIGMDQLYQDPALALGLPPGVSLEQGLGELLGGLFGIPPDSPLIELIFALAKNLFAAWGFNLVPPELGYESPEDLAALSVDELLHVATRTPFFEGILHSGRGVDLDGDGYVNSGHKFWTANLFRTRDVVRQGVVDHVQMIHAMQQFDGVKVWDFDVNRNGLRDDLAGDFDGDGRVDIGGPDVNYYSMGQSLGAFFSAILPAVEPAVAASVPVSSGAGLTDIAVRTIQGGTVEAVHLELQGPFLVGGPSELVAPAQTATFQSNLPYELVPDAEKPESCDDVGPILYPPCGARPKPLEPGRRYLAWDVAVGNNERIFPITVLDELEEGDRIEARNLFNGEEGHAIAGPEGAFRISLASDVNDPVLITVTDGYTGAVKYTDSVKTLTRGYGFKRGSKEFRRIIGLAQTIIDPADPGNYAPHIFMDPLPGQLPRNVLSMSTVGDMNVPINTGIAYARALGVLDYLTPNPARGGKTDNQALIDAHVIEGIEDISPFTAVVDGMTKRVLFDPADFDEGADELASPRVPGFADLTPPQPPLRPRVPSKRVGDPDSAAAGVSGMSLPYLGVEGEHGFLFSSPFKPFNMDLFCINQIAWFFVTGGREIRDDPCLATDDCDFLYGRAPE